MNDDYDEISFPNYDFGINRPMPDEEAIRSQMPDFEHILQKSSNTPAKGKLRMIWISVSGAAIAASIALLWFVGPLKNWVQHSLDNNIAKTDGFNVNADTALVRVSNSPVNTLQYLNVDADKDYIVPIGQNATVKINKGTLVDANGNVVHGQVKIAYKLLNNAGDILAGKIPLMVENANQAAVLNPKIMFEVYASGATIAPGKFIEIEANNIAQCDLYYCKKGNVSWKLEQTIAAEKITYTNTVEEMIGNIDTVDVSTGVSNVSIPKYLSSTNKSNIEKPLKPRIRDINKHAFEIHVDKTKYPELAQYNKVVFETESADEWIGTENYEWEHIDVKKAAKPGKYELTFYSRTFTKTCEAYPVFTNKSEYMRAMENYNKQLAKVELDKINKMENQVNVVDKNQTLHENRNLSGTDSFTPKHSNTTSKSSGKIKIKVQKFGLFSFAQPLAVKHINKVSSVQFFTSDKKHKPDFLVQTTAENGDKFNASYDNIRSLGWFDLSREQDILQYINPETNAVETIPLAVVKSEILAGKKEIILEKKERPTLPSPY